MDEHEHSGRKGSGGGTSTSDQEALVDVPLSFELSGFEPLPVGATRGPYASDVPALPIGHGVRQHESFCQSTLCNAGVDTGGEAGPSAKWYHAAFHNVTAVVGVGVLGLPYAFSYLGWIWGVIALVTTLAASLYTAYLLAALHEEADGTRHNRYVDLGRAILGMPLICSPCTAACV